MRLAIATCNAVPAWECDDRPFHADLAERGIEAAQVPWEEAGADWGAFDACLIRTTWNYQEHREDFVAWAERVAAKTALWNPLPVVRWNTHKSYLRDLDGRGVPVIPTVWLPPGRRADVRAIMSERGWKRGFLKPAVGATARETLRFEAGDPAAQAHADRMTAREEMQLQPYLSSVETEGELSAIFIDGERTHAVRKIPVAGDYRVQDDFGAKDGPVDLSKEEAALARRVIDAAPPGLLYGRVDFLRDDAGALRVTELELVEPSLFFRHARHAAARLADAILAKFRPR